MKGAPPVVILAGGEGRRMGGGKPLRPLGTTTLLGQALSLARTYSHDVAVAVREGAQVGGAADVPLLLDDPAIEGPLAGLASALRFGARLRADCVLTLPCDSPRLPRDLAARLQGALGADVQVAMGRSAGRLHPVCALWRVESLQALPAYLATGRRSLRDFAAAVGMTAVDWPCAGLDPFANANTPSELAALQPGRGMVARALP